jgi:hypothetical protein
MTYRNRFVVCVKSGGQILREQDDTVTLPFGSAYTVLLKNLNSVRAIAQVWIDGTDTTDGTGLIVPANGEIDLQRFIRNGNLKTGNSFKFIERTEGIENHRGIKAEDGLIRVEYRFEIPQGESRSIVEHHHYHNHDYYRPYWEWPRVHLGSQPVWSGNVQGGTQGPLIGGLAPVSFCNTSSVDVTAPVSFNMNEASVNEAGITVPGSESDQVFVNGDWFPTESQSHTIVLRLRGRVGEQPVQRAVTVNRKPKCSTCGRVNKATNKFCAECGTALVLL